MIGLIILCIIIILHILGFIIAQLHSNETSGITPYGTLVNTDHGKMHLYEMGDSSKETIIILPGLGDALPCADFGPLMRDLSQKYHVICAEYLGIGFSDSTTLDRTCESYISELRQALSEYGCKPPYILLPHSCSGIYCEYYVSMYPDEISHLIELDCTSTASDKNLSTPNWLYHVFHFWQTVGITRLMYFCMPAMQKEEYGYTKKEQHDYKIFNYHNITPAFKSQNELLLPAIKEVRKLPYPSSVATLKLQSEQGIKNFKEDYQIEHMKRLGPNAKSIVIPGSLHMMHQKDHKRIASEVFSFIDNNLK